MAGAWLRISTLCFGIVILSVVSTPSSFAADENSEVAPTGAPPAEIEAKAYGLKTIRPSRSGRVYLFEKTESVTEDAETPSEGKIFLLRDGDIPVMALRVLKQYPETNQIAAKKLLPYEGYSALAPESRYRAFEKIGDRVSSIPPSPEDLQDLKELESPPPSPEPEPTQEPEITDSEVDSEIKESETEDEIDEVGSYYPNFFTMGIGLVYNAKVPGPDPKFGGGLIYSRNLSTSFAIEGGFFYYQSSGEVNSETVSTTVLPLIGNIRYQHRYGELWTAYLYGGLLYPYVLSNIGATKRQLALIQTVSPSIGLGVFLQTGPNWYLRLNAGTDNLALGVTLRY